MKTEDCETWIANNSVTGQALLRQAFKAGQAHERELSLQRTNRVKRCLGKLYQAIPDNVELDLDDETECLAEQCGSLVAAGLFGDSESFLCEAHIAPRDTV